MMMPLQLPGLPSIHLSGFTLPKNDVNVRKIKRMEQPRESTSRLISMDE